MAGLAGLLPFACSACHSITCNNSATGLCADAVCRCCAYVHAKLSGVLQDSCSSEALRAECNIICRHVGWKVTGHEAYPIGWLVAMRWMQQ
jgi:hypothetical protein